MGELYHDDSSSFTASRCGAYAWLSLSIPIELAKRVDCEFENWMNENQHSLDDTDISDFLEDIFTKGAEATLPTHQQGE